ncbi:hypothetical protein B0A52_07924 [Exophiala mesophila]|uniref:Molybdenum cofactor sulfurase n=1 Tax=Exophiala mesophila TaxID=212818 RepID=A0A438MXL6_EXOME|nr:hypothetical protein B0A52_07924 [Exophiala mesophila]
MIKAVSPSPASASLSDWDTYGFGISVPNSTSELAVVTALADMMSVANHTATIDERTGYITNIDSIRDLEYPGLRDTSYLDHAGTTLYARSLIEAYSQDLTSNIFGNPHSASAASQLSSRRIEDIRVQVLRFFNADPDDFDVVFVSNATAAMKLVGEALQDGDGGFTYCYHAEAHTSMVGLRELATQGSSCFSNDSQVQQWFEQRKTESSATSGPILFAYPGQSNMTGRRFPLEWCERARTLNQRCNVPVFTLLDAAALASTSPLDFSDANAAPDFTALSFYKIFGFPDLGALIVRKASASILRHRKYFGGGTVDSVTVGDDHWHAIKESSIHSRLEDGTVAFHNIVALESALRIHSSLFGSMSVISKHAKYLASTLRNTLRNLRHANGTPVCQIYAHENFEACSQGPIIAFNLLDDVGQFVSNTEIEKLAIVKNIQFRTGGLCNPGGVASHLGLSTDEMRQNYAAGHRCGSLNDILNGKPTGALRVSFGAMSSLQDVTAFIDFIQEFYVSAKQPDIIPSSVPVIDPLQTGAPFVVESLSVYPIKSCAAYRVPPETTWEVGPKGLAWDREWCLVHAGSHVALSQKKYPRMALIQPEIDLPQRILRVSARLENGVTRTLEIGLDSMKSSSWSSFRRQRPIVNKTSIVCGEDVDVDVYTSHQVTSFFTELLEVPCTLARFPQSGTVRHAQVRRPGDVTGHNDMQIGRSITLSNESPILLVSRSSVNRLNEDIKQNGGAGKAVAAASFRGNIVIAQELDGAQQEDPYAEDEWCSVQIGDDPACRFEVLGPCQRCQMVCVDQKNAQRRQEPFSTLAKTRKRGGRVWEMQFTYGLVIVSHLAEDLYPVYEDT